PERLHRTGAFPIPASLTQRVTKVEPAGRADVYDLTVDATQNFALAAGVFAHNSIDDDPPGAPRYTEARLAAISNEMLADIENETVAWMPNYDNRHQQPTVLPARLPNLLVNGSAGIAVGMATNIPPHNLRGNRDAIVVTELPYAVNKASLIEKIAELVQNKRLAGISDIRDESDREGMRIVIEVKRDDDATLVLNNLYKHTAMQSAFNFN